MPTSRFLEQSNDYLNTALQAVDEAGKVLINHLGHLKHIRDKSVVGDLVTEADQESEKCILSVLKKKYPKHAFLAEESGQHLSAEQDYLWIIDPLDGTTNYAHQYPMFAISIALLYQQQPLIGVIYNPVTNELFRAALGEGAFLNDNKIHVSMINRLDKCLLVTGFAYDRLTTSDNNYAEFSHFTNLSQGVRRSGSAALDLAFVAAGRCDGYWERGIQPWDIAAGVLLVKEAGGLVSNYSGHTIDLFEGKILASNELVHQELVKELSHLSIKK